MLQITMTRTASTLAVNQPQMAIDNVCAWPNLTLMPDGEVVALLHNQPSHLLWEGDIDCWTSEDGGATWGRRGVAALHEPGTNQGHIAAGVGHNGDLIAITSGHTNRPAPGTAPAEVPAFESGRITDPWVNRSADGGRTWQTAKHNFLQRGASSSVLIPYGDIHRLGNGTLAACMYHQRDPIARTGPNNREACDSHVLRSQDDGATWAEPSLIGRDLTETAMLAVDDQRWLAAARTHDAGNEQRLDLYQSDDAGRTWQYRQPLTAAHQHPAHLLRLAGGAIVLTYGIRNEGLRGLGRRISHDGGQTWSRPAFLLDFGQGGPDLGYPSSVQLDDGDVLTAFYARKATWHGRYHMGVLRWRLPA